MSTTNSASHACMHTLAAHGLYIHSIPGRLRLELPALLGNPSLAGRLEDSLAQTRGFKSVHASPLTGRILVHYDQRQVSATQVMLTLQASDCLPNCHHCAGPRAANGLFDVAVEHVLKLGVHMALGI